MGGPGSGRRRTLTDEERKARGTFKVSRSDEVAIQRAAEKIIAGPWLTEIPNPTLPLSGVGLKKYQELTRALFDQNKLTIITQARAEQAALLIQQQHERLTKGKSVPAAMTIQIERMLRDLDIASKAKPIASPGEQRKKFGRVGFSIRLAAPE